MSLCWRPTNLRPPKEITKECPKCEYFGWFNKEGQKETHAYCMLWKSGKGRLIQNRWTTPSWCPKNKEN